MSNQTAGYYGDAQRIERLRNDDEILIVRPDGLFRIHQDVLRKPKQNIEWDVAGRITRTLPSFTTNAFSSSRKEQLSVPYHRALVDNHNGLLQFRTQTSGSCSWATMNGVLPKTGKFWLAYNAFSTNGVPLPNSFKLHVGSQPAQILNCPVSSDTEISFFTPTPDDITVCNSDMSVKTIYAGRYNLILFDMDAGVTLAGIGTKNAGSASTRNLGGKQIHAIVSNSVPNVERILRWQASRPNEAAVPIPTGYQPLRLDNSSLPENLTHGDIITATSSGPFNELWVVAGDRFQYVLLENNQPLLVLLESNDNRALHQRVPGDVSKMTLDGGLELRGSRNNLVVARHGTDYINRINRLVDMSAVNNVTALNVTLQQIQTLADAILITDGLNSTKTIESSVVVGPAIGT
jgi:hypothetical protein